MRLRQVALASRDLDGVTAALDKVFGLKVAFNDPHIHVYGLRNAVLPAGTGFVEVVEPVRDDASAARFIARRGGDAGYMVILQVADAEAERARAVALGVRVVDDLDSRDYRCAHFHPADFGGVLTSFDQQKTTSDPMEPEGDWMPAGPDWHRAQAAGVAGIAAVVLSTPDPAALAMRWSELVARPLDHADPLRLPLDMGAVRFEAGEGGTLLSGLELAVADPDASLERARSAGLPVEGGAVLVGGVRIRPVSAH